MAKPSHKEVPSGSKNMFGDLMDDSERINASRCAAPLDECLSGHYHAGMTTEELYEFLGPEPPAVEGVRKSPRAEDQI